MPELCNICIVTSTADCTNDGIETRTCVKHKLHEETRNVDALGHNMAFNNEITAATCITEGFGGYVCIRNECNHIDMAIISALGHQGLTPAFAVTCTAAGNSQISGTCTREGCGQSFPGTVIPALGHDFDWQETRTGVETGTCQYIGCIETDIRLTLALGNTGPAGGIIFYVADGQDGRSLGFTVQGYSGGTGNTAYLNFVGYTAYYLEAAPSNISGTQIWAGINTTSNENRDYIPGLSQNDTDQTDWEIGRGRMNTAIIIARGINYETPYTTPAASACAALGNDWFLPSKNELNAMYIASTAPNNVASLQPSVTNAFWSSSQSRDNMAWQQYFNAVSQNPTSKLSASLAVRAIRAF